MTAVQTETVAATPATQPLTLVAPPVVGAPWPGIAGVYAGIARGEGGEADHHLVMLDQLPPEDLTWAAAIKWANSLGDGASLPTRSESALLYANMRDKVKTGDWYWTGTQYSAYYAWLQYFDGGGQSTSLKKAEARARAVRRLPLQSFNPSSVA